MEPVSIAVIAGAAGGVAGKFVEKAWDQGAKWLDDYFRDHAPAAKQEAERNALDFLAELAQRVKALEQQGEHYKAVVEESLKHPDFSVLLQKAMISSAQTDDKQKHALLARLVAGRMTHEPESLFALCSKLACDAIPNLSVRHMKILGLLTDLMLVRPASSPAGLAKDMNQMLFLDWLTNRLRVYTDLTLMDMDFLHLESLSCLKWDPIVHPDLRLILSPKKGGWFAVDYAAFSSTEVGKKIEELWNAGLQQCIPTTVGQLIGVCVSDVLTGGTTSLDKWGMG